MTLRPVPTGSPRAPDEPPAVATSLSALLSHVRFDRTVDPSSYERVALSALAEPDQDGHPATALALLALGARLDDVVAELHAAHRQRSEFNELLARLVAALEAECTEGR